MSMSQASVTDDQASCKSSDTDSGAKEFFHVFQPEVLRDLLVAWGDQNPDKLASIIDFSRQDDSYRKLFVHGVPATANQAEVLKVFGKFGELDSVSLHKAESNTQYAFVTFTTVDAAQRALKHPKKLICEKETACRLAKLSECRSRGLDVPPIPIPRIFVRDLKLDATEAELQSYFSRFGTVEDVSIAYNSHGSKGFGFVTFSSFEAARNAVRSPNHLINGKLVNVDWARTEDRRESRKGPAALNYPTLVAVPPLMPLSLTNSTPPAFPFVSTDPSSNCLQLYYYVPIAPSGNPL